MVNFGHSGSSNFPALGRDGESGAMKIDWIEVVAVLAAAGILIFLLFVPPIIGLANDGDFQRIIAAFSLGAVDTQDEFKYINTPLEFNGRHYLKGTFDSSEHYVAFVAIAIDSMVHRQGGEFDLRAIGLVHGAIYLMAFALALRLTRGAKVWARAGAIGVLLLVSMDVLYVSQMNAFYQDTAALIFLALSAALVCRVLTYQRRRDAIGLVIALLLLAASKTQHAPLLFPVLVLLCWLRGRLLPGLSDWVRAASIAAILVVSLFTFRGSQEAYRTVPLFSEIFYRVLPPARDPLPELRELGLDESYRKYIGMHGYSEGAPATDADFSRQFLSRTSHLRLAFFLVRHPARAWRLLKEGLSEIGAQRPFMGNYERRTGKPETSMSRAFSLWSGMKRGAFEGRGRLYLAYVTVLSGLFGWLLWTRRRVLPEGSFYAGVTLMVVVWLAMAIGILGDGTDTIRHSLLFTALNDLMFVCTAMVAIMCPRNGRGSLVLHRGNVGGNGVATRWTTRSRPLRDGYNLERIFA